MMKVNYEHGAKVIKYQIQRMPGLLEHYLELRACDFEFYLRLSAAYIVFLRKQSCTLQSCDLIKSHHQVHILNCLACSALDEVVNRGDHDNTACS